MILPRWFRHHKRALAAPQSVDIQVGWLRLTGEAHLSADRLKQMVWRRWHRWPTVMRPYLHKEIIRIMGIKISWTPPASRIDGTVVDATQFQSVVIAQLGTDGNYADIATIGGGETSHVLANPPPGSYAFNVRYVDVQGQQGASSADVSCVVPEPVPVNPPVLSAPSGVTVDIVP